MPFSLPGFEDFMGGESQETALPTTEDDQRVGPAERVSVEVNEDGVPINPNEVERDIMSILNHRLQRMESSENPSWGNPEKIKFPRCPVFADKKPDGGRLFTSYITGSVEDVECYVDLIDTLLTASDRDTYLIYEDTPGGYVASGGIIASAIHHSKADVYTIARGLCASSGALIHSAAKPGKARVTPFAVMMYHMSSHFAQGVSTHIAQEAIDQVRYVNECLLNKALQDGHITRDEFDKIQHGEEIFIPASEFLKRTKQEASDV